MEKEFILKHKETPVLIFKLDIENYKLLGISDIIKKEHCPFAIISDNKTQHEIELNNWLKSRGLAQSRKDLDKIKRMFNVKDSQELTVKTMGLNLTDQYWFHKTEDDFSWKNVNYFDNTFDKLIPGGNANPDIDDSVNDQSPNLCVDGSIEKRWVIKDGERVLLKGSYHKRMQEPFNERIVSDILDLFCIEHVKYRQLRTKDKNIPYSECTCMVNRDTEFVNAKYIFDHKPSIRDDFLPFFITMCKENGITDVKEKIDQMNAIDFLIGNDDRHRGNFGIIRDANSLNWLKLAPIFDNGNCLFFDRDDDTMDSWGIDSIGKAFEDSNRLNLSNLSYSEWYKKAEGKNVVEVIRNGLEQNELLSDTRINKICEIVQERINIFENGIKGIGN